MMNLKIFLPYRSELKGLYIVLLLLLMVAFLINVITGVNFFGLSNLLNVMRSGSMMGIAALGQMMVIISGGLDLSVGAIISTANVCAATWMNGDNMLLLPVTILIVIIGGLIGMLNGLLVTKRNVPPFIATLGVAIVLNGIRLIWTGGMVRGRIPLLLKKIGTGSLLGIPTPFFFFLVIVIGMTILLTFSSYGRRLYTVGTNESVGRLSGIRTDFIVIKAYMISGAMAALVGILLGGYTGMADQHIGEGYDLDTIAAAVLGGAVIGGGIGSTQGTIIGVFIMMIVTNLTLLAHFPIQSQMLIKGILIILALWINNRKRAI